MIRIGPYTLGSRAVLAPMAGITDRPFRMLCRALGAGLAASEMLTSDVRLWTTPKSRRRMDHAGESEPRVVQLAGHDADALAEAARLNVDAGAQIIDLNMGCPAKKVCGKLCGSALLRDEPLVAHIISRVIAAVHVPVTLKIRTGWSHTERNGVAIAILAERCGIQALAVHGRTREDFYSGDAEYETIRAIKESVRIPVFANGDIDNGKKARAVLDFTGADGVMIGRASRGAPWVFREVNSFLSSKDSLIPLPRDEVRAMILAHLESLYAFYGEHTGIRIARKHLGWYCKPLAGPGSLLRDMLTAERVSSQFELTKEFLETADAGEEDHASSSRARASLPVRSLGASAA